MRLLGLGIGTVILSVSGSEQNARLALEISHIAAVGRE
jgi:hypothetical protein